MDIVDEEKKIVQVSQDNSEEENYDESEEDCVQKIPIVTNNNVLNLDEVRDCYFIIYYYKSKTLSGVKNSV